MKKKVLATTALMLSSLLFSVPTIANEDYIPLRSSFEGKGYGVNWTIEKPNTIVVDINGNSIEFENGSDTIVTDKGSFSLRENTYIENGVTYISKEGLNLCESLYLDIKGDALDYSDMTNWAYWNEGSDKAADLFIVCPTVDIGRNGNLIADVNDEGYRSNFTGALNMELGIYDDVSAVYAPYYRQATFPIYNMTEEDREDYLAFAYEDVKNAFIYYAENADESRPLILAGFSQGSDMVIRLMEDLFDEEAYNNRLAAAYCIGWSITDEDIAKYPHLKMAQGELDTGVIITFNSEAEEINSSLMVGENEKTYSINPLNWTTDSTPADKSLNKGACFTDYSGSITEEIPQLTGAYIDENRGTLKVTDVSPEDYPGSIFEDGIYHLYDYQFFYRNLEENVGNRLNVYINE